MDTTASHVLAGGVRSLTRCLSLLNTFKWWLTPPCIQHSSASTCPYPLDANTSHVLLCGVRAFNLSLSLMNTSTYIHSGSHCTVSHSPLRPHVPVRTLDIRPNASHVILCDVKMLPCLLLLKHCPIVIDTALLPTVCYLLMSLSPSFCYVLSLCIPLHADSQLMEQSRE